MRKLYYVLWVISVIFIYGCAQKGYLNDAEKNRIKKITNWFERMKRVEIIQLDNRENNMPIYQLRTAIWNEKYIVGTTAGHPGSVYIWDRKGKYRGKMGSPGKGPGEYNEAWLVFFHSEDVVGLIDSATSLLHLYSIKTEKPVFIDSVDIGSLYKSVPTSVYTRGDKKIMIFDTGFKTPMIVVADKNWKPLRRFHEHKKPSYIAMGLSLVGNDFIAVTDGVDHKTRISHSDKVYVYSFEGKLLQTMHTGEVNYRPVPLRMDKARTVIFIDCKKNGLIFDLNGNKLHSFAYGKINAEDTDLPENQTGVFITGNYNEYICYTEMPKDDNKSLILHIYEMRIPE